MAFRLRSLGCLAAAAALFAACDRTPLDPALADRQAALLAGDTDASVIAASPTSLHHLFGQAISRVGQKEGTAGLARLLDDWRRFNDEAKAALKDGSRTAAQIKVSSVRSEEIRIVLRELGAQTAHRVTEQVGLGLARVRVELTSAETRGTDVSRARVLTSEVADLIGKANAALQAGQAPAALDYATQASDELDGVVHYTIALHRIAGLETLFENATKKFAHDNGADTLTVLLLPLERMNAAARDALRAGNRREASTKLDAARREQIRIVLALLGPAAARNVIDNVDGSLAAVRARITTITDPNVQDRAKKMVAEAASLNGRATAAWNEHDAATALDLASHAAGLINALQHAMVSY